MREEGIKRRRLRLCEFLEGNNFDDGRRETPPNPEHQRKTGRRYPPHVIRTLPIVDEEVYSSPFTIYFHFYNAVIKNAAFIILVESKRGIIFSTGYIYII
jgi:type IV secretory pathway VirB9-like protein